MSTNLVLKPLEKPDSINALSYPSTTSQPHSPLSISINDEIRVLNPKSHSSNLSATSSTKISSIQDFLDQYKSPAEDTDFTGFPSIDFDEIENNKTKQKKIKKRKEKHNPISSSDITLVRKYGKNYSTKSNFKNNKLLSITNNKRSIKKVSFLGLSPSDSITSPLGQIECCDDNNSDDDMPRVIHDTNDIDIDEEIPLDKFFAALKNGGVKILTDSQKKLQYKQTARIVRAASVGNTFDFQKLLNNNEPILKNRSPKKEIRFRSKSVHDKKELNITKNKHNYSKTNTNLSSIIDDDLTDEITSNQFDSSKSSVEIKKKRLSISTISSCSSSTSSSWDPTDSDETTSDESEKEEKETNITINIKEIPTNVRDRSMARVSFNKKRSKSIRVRGRNKSRGRKKSKPRGKSASRRSRSKSKKRKTRKFTDDDQVFPSIDETDEQDLPKPRITASKSQCEKQFDILNNQFIKLNKNKSKSRQRSWSSLKVRTSKKLKQRYKSSKEIKTKKE